jgi:hypothetical protein
MSAFGTRSITWSHGTDDFCLSKIGQRLDLEEKCGAGIGHIYSRLVTGTWFTNDYRETIRLGLIGGGMKPQLAKDVVERHVDQKPQAEFVLLAQQILQAVMVPPPGEQPGKKTRARRDIQRGQPSSMPKADSADSQSMASAPDSAGRRE